MLSGVVHGRRRRDAKPQLALLLLMAELREVPNDATEQLMVRHAKAPAEAPKAFGVGD
jgi:hypothetical protein